MIELKFSAAATILQGYLHGNDGQFRGAHNDTRQLQAGNLYIAIKGLHHDGHDFLLAAKEKGAVVALVQRYIDIDLPQIVVADTALAMAQLAKYWRQQFAIPFIGITGSAGKTTTRQMTGAILSQIGPTLISSGNHNNQFGVPLTLFHLHAEHQFAVIEMGADRPNDISYLVDIVQPQVAIITNVAAVHLQVSEAIGFGSLEGVFAEKSQIFSRLGTEGVAIINADDDFYPRWQKLLMDTKHMSFGLSPAADVTAYHLTHNADMQYNFDLHTPQGEVNVSLSSMGKHNVTNAVAAAAAALNVGAYLPAIKAGLENVPLVARRLNRFVGLKGSTLIDDSYNANVRSVPAVIEMLAQYPNKRILVFGDMREIGPSSAEEHRKIGHVAKQAGIDYLFAYGKDSQYTVETFGDQGYFFTSHDDLIHAIKPLLDEKTTVAIKGSLSMKLNIIVEALTANS